jgi:hypothetical protein
MKMKPPSDPKKQTQSKPISHTTKGRPNNPNVEITTAWSSAARIVTPEG